MRLPSDVPVKEVQGGLARKSKGMITIRWALWFSVVLVMVFAVSIGYHLGMEYAEQFIKR